MEARAPRVKGRKRGRVNGEDEGDGEGTGCGEATADGARGKGVMLGVGRKVGSRNGSRGCCATINTPRDATRHISLARSHPSPVSLQPRVPFFTHFLSLSLFFPLAGSRSLSCSFLFPA